MIRGILYRLSGRLPCRLIKIGDEPYLERYYIGEVFGVTFYLHRFVAADGDRNVHDHPWRFAGAVVLVGQYLEERLAYLDVDLGWVSTYRRLFPGRLNRLGPRQYHKILSVCPETWTLFFHGRRVKKWGFLERGAYGVYYHQPYNVSAQMGWFERAQRGHLAGREPLRRSLP